MRHLTTHILFFAVLWAVSCSGNIPKTRSDAAKVFADVETAPVQSKSDAADDPAIWVHPTEPEKSILIGTDKNKKDGGLYLYDLQGKQVSFQMDPALNNVDIRQNVSFDSVTMDIVGASRRTDSTIALYQMKQGTLVRMDEKHPIKVSSPYGFCLGHRSDSLFAFNIGKDGKIEQVHLFLDSTGAIQGTKLITRHIASQGEGCVMDDANGILWVGEEDKGIWKFDLKDTAGTLLDSVQSGRIRADVEGISLYQVDSVSGFLVISSQGDNSFAVYDRTVPHKYRGSFAVDSGTVSGIGAVEETDGVEVTSANLGDAFPKGLCMAQDGWNGTSNQNFKMVDWRKIEAALSLK